RELTTIGDPRHVVGGPPSGGGLVALRIVSVERAGSQGRAKRQQRRGVRACSSSWHSLCSTTASVSTELRLTVTAADAHTVIRVDGRLSGEGVLELDGVCRKARRPLELDLTHLSTVDDPGVATLRRLPRRGVLLAPASPSGRLLLKGTSPTSRPRRPGVRGHGRHVRSPWIA